MDTASTARGCPALQETVSGCMADVSLAGSAFDSYEEAAWVFCACRRAISVAINEDWFTNANFVCLGLLIYLSLLCCVVCCTYRNAKHAAEQRVRAGDAQGGRAWERRGGAREDFEMETLKAAERYWVRGAKGHNLKTKWRKRSSNGSPRASWDTGLGGIGSASMRADEVYIEASRAIGCRTTRREEAFFDRQASEWK